MRTVAPGTIASLQSKSDSRRCFVEYEIDLTGAELKLQTHATFKKVLKIGTKLFVVAELMGNAVPEYSLEIMQVAAMNYIPKSARYIDSVVVSGDHIIHFFVQPKGASTITVPAKELLAHEVRRPNSPPREEANIAFKTRKDLTIGR